MKSRFSGRLSVMLVIAMLLSIVPPAYTANEPASGPLVISTLTDDINISVGRGEGIEVGTKGVISRDGKDIAKYEVKQVKWGFSRISVSDLAPGEVIRVGDSARITSLPANTGEKKVKKGSSKLLWTVVAIGAIAALVGGKGGSKSSAAPAGSSSIALATQKASITADGASNTTITATITDANGDPAADGTAVAFSSTLGTIIPAQATTTGGTATATLTSGTSTGTATVTAISGGRSTTVNVAFVSGSGGGTGTIDLAAGPTSIQVVDSGGTQTQSTVTATCRDALGNLANGGTVTFTSSIGSIVGTATINASGVATTTFSSNVTGTATITASWSGIDATTAVDVTPGPPHSVVLDCVPGSIQCDGNSFATVTATVRDIAGNLVTDGTVVSFTVAPDVNGGGNGSITPQAQTSHGVATVQLFSKDSDGNVSRAGTAAVRARVLRADQPAGIPIATADLQDMVTYVQIISLPVAEIHIGATTNNIRGWDTVGNTSTIEAVVYDASHNPVPDGTAVYFTANHGMIYGNGGTAGRVTMSTTRTGRASATLVTDASGDGTWDGHVDVTATSGTVTLTEPGLVIFSGWPSTLPNRCSAEAASDTLTAVGGQTSVSVIALDINGNPIVDGTKITATTSKGTIAVTGDSGTIGGTIMFTLSTSTSATAPTQLGPGLVTIRIPSGGPNPETGGGPVILTVPFTVIAVPGS